MACRKKDPELETVLLDIVAPHTAGDPMGKGRWLNCRLRDIQERLDEEGHGVSLPVISRLLQQHDYRLRANVKALTGKPHPDRDRQFQHIHEHRAEHWIDSMINLIYIYRMTNDKQPINWFGMLERLRKHAEKGDKYNVQENGEYEK